MKCAHCLKEVHDTKRIAFITNDKAGVWAAEYFVCPNPDCGKANIFLISGDIVRDNAQMGGGWKVIYHNGQPGLTFNELIRPRSIARTPVPEEVPVHVKQGYEESALVLNISPKASAALSRRCLQSILREEAKVKAGNLSAEIQELLNRNNIPTYLSENIDAIRNIGNFAAHPSKSAATNEIVDVEPGEAEWNLEVLDMLFDFYYVQPGIAKKRKDDLNAKLAAAGKPPMK